MPIAALPGPFPDTVSIIRIDAGASDGMGGVTASEVVVNAAYQTRITDNPREVKNWLQLQAPGYDVNKVKGSVGQYDAALVPGMLLRDGSVDYRIRVVAHRRRRNGPPVFTVMILEKGD